MMKHLALGGWLAAAMCCFAAPSAEIADLIRRDDLAELKRTLASNSNAVSSADARGMTPLHHAAILGSDEAVQLLLKSGADVKARNNFEATPLVLAASSPTKVKMLVAAGSDVNAQAKSGATPLIIAAGRSGSYEAVKLLLDRGANPNLADAMGTSALIAAAYQGETATVKLLLEKGADVKAFSNMKAGPLAAAINGNNIDIVRMLIARGADLEASRKFSGQVKHGAITLNGQTPLVLASAHSSPEIVKALLDAGAKVNVQDQRGLSPLMAAVASDRQEPKVIEMLLKAGADPNAKDIYGSSVLDWAAKTGSPFAQALLKKAGAKSAEIGPADDTVASLDRPAPTVALTRSIDLLTKSSAGFFKQSGCVSCHHQSIASRAQKAAISRGIPTSFNAKDSVGQVAFMNPFESQLLMFNDPGGEVDTVGTILNGAADAGMTASSLTDAAIHYIAGKQAADGKWFSFGVMRPPSEDSNISRTIVAIRALKTFGWPARRAEFDERVRKAQAWLIRQEPRTSYEKAEVLLGLHWAGAPKSDLKRAAEKLLADQRADGGWGQNPYLAPDAYATGLALHALHESGSASPADLAYAKGVAYLLRTQKADGSWHVRSRSPRFQPYFESGFPYGHDQWISAMATAYASLAITPAIEPTVTQRRESVQAKSRQ